jgi:hypothetical protein
MRDLHDSRTAMDELGEPTLPLALEGRIGTVVAFNHADGLFEVQLDDEPGFFGSETVVVGAAHVGSAFARPPPPLLPSLGAAALPQLRPQSKTEVTTDDDEMAWACRRSWRAAGPADLPRRGDCDATLAPSPGQMAAWVAARHACVRLDLRGLGERLTDAHLWALAGGHKGPNKGPENGENENGSGRNARPSGPRIEARRQPADMLSTVDLSGCGNVTPAGAGVLIARFTSAENCNAESNLEFSLGLRWCWRVAGPGPRWSPAEVVAHQLKALQEGGRPAHALPRLNPQDGVKRPHESDLLLWPLLGQLSQGPTSGTAKAFVWASPENQIATGPEEKCV